MAQGPVQSTGFDPSNPAHRQVIVDEVHRLMEQAYPGDWNHRCLDVATHVIYLLKAYGVAGYQIAAGQVKEVAGGPPAVLFKGEYKPISRPRIHAGFKSRRRALTHLRLLR
jgi:hypothetical protein